MDLELRQQFIEQWTAYFPNAALPIVLYYTDDETVLLAEAEKSHHCIICTLAAVRAGRSLRFDKETVRCGGGKRYLGFVQEMSPNFAHFLSCGIPGKMEGERYKRSPELVEDYLASQPPFEAPARYIVFKRWDDLNENDDPAVVVFFASGDVLSGLFTLANFDEVDPQAVKLLARRAHFRAEIVRKLMEADLAPKRVPHPLAAGLGPCAAPDELTFSVPWPKFKRMVEQMDESFLITGSWGKVQERMRLK